MFKPIRHSALIHHSKLNIFAIAHPWRSRNQFVIWSMCDGSRARTHTCTLSATIYSAIGGFFLLLPLRIPTIIVRNSNARQRLAYGFFIWIEGMLFVASTQMLYLQISRGIELMDHINRYSFDLDRTVATTFKRFH